jgi:hypothetical protein
MSLAICIARIVFPKPVSPNRNAISTLVQNGPKRGFGFGRELAAFSQTFIGLETKDYRVRPVRPFRASNGSNGNLDARSGGEILKILATLNRELSKTIVMVTHDPHAASYATHERHLEKGVLLEGAYVGAD